LRGAARADAVSRSTPATTTRGRRDKTNRRPAAGAGAPPQRPQAEHCISSAGVDLNEYYGVPEQLLQLKIPPFCDRLHAGQPWGVTAAWAMNTEFAARPAGFEPAGETPLDDFRAKFVGVRYVIDAGTRQETSVAFRSGPALFVGEFEGDVIVNPVTLGTLEPLGIGDHTLDIIWEFNALHCDGFEDDLAESCAPAGDVEIVTRAPFTVVADHH
jgi:hypothetical protein